ncbi:MAG: 3-hydroxyacyl-CoA dehydrogenase family protein [Chloroflexi bacterium]|nr:3-hydroxyacyl-CoA dehydrogenase family protein [Chloroflexota bacterium]
MSERPERIAVVGAGLMGTSIGLDWARSGFGVTIYDSDPDRVQSVLERARQVGQALVDGGVIEVADLDAALGRLHPTADLGDAVGTADYVAEAIVEDLAVKQAFYAELDAMTRPDTVLASNTSSLMPSALAAPTKHPERVIIAHYFNPGHLIPVVEVVVHPGTSPAAVDTTTRLLRAAGKTPALLRKEVPGFIANRLQSALLREALALVEDGVCSMEDLDAVVSLGFGRRLAAFGPFTITDMAGLDVWQAIAGYLYPRISAATEPQPMLAERAARGDLGLKSGQGFYAWPPEAAREALAKRDAELLRHLRPEHRD